MKKLILIALLIFYLSGIAQERYVCKAMLLKDEIISTGDPNKGTLDFLNLKKKTWINILKYAGDSNWIFEYNGEEGIINETKFAADFKLLRLAEKKFKEDQEAHLILLKVKLDSIKKAEKLADSIRITEMNRRQKEFENRVDSFRKIREAREALEKELAIKARQTAEAKRRKLLVSKYNSEIANKILDNRIWLGMTDEMAEASIGRPEKINRSVGTYGTHEQWVYENRYLYFENGKLTSWQDSR